MFDEASYFNLWKSIYNPDNPSSCNLGQVSGFLKAIAEVSAAIIPVQTSFPLSKRKIRRLQFRANKSSRPLIDEYFPRRQITRLRWRSRSCSWEKEGTSPVASSALPLCPPFDPALGGSRASISSLCRDHIGSTTFVRCLRSNKFFNSKPTDCSPLCERAKLRISMYRKLSCIDSPTATAGRTNAMCEQSPESPFCFLILPLIPRVLLFPHSRSLQCSSCFYSTFEYRRKFYFWFISEETRSRSSRSCSFAIHSDSSWNA